MKLIDKNFIKKLSSPLIFSVFFLIWSFAIAGFHQRKREVKEMTMRWKRKSERERGKER